MFILSWLISAEPGTALDGLVYGSHKECCVHDEPSPYYVASSHRIPQSSLYRFGIRNQAVKKCSTWITCFTLLCAVLLTIDAMFSKVVHVEVSDDTAVDITLR